MVNHARYRTRMRMHLKCMRVVHAYAYDLCLSDQSLYSLYNHSDMESWSKRTPGCTLKLVLSIRYRRGATTVLWGPAHSADPRRWNGGSITLTYCI